MTTAAATIVLCSCEDSMAPDAGAVAKACTGATVKTARHLCRSEAGLFDSLAKAPGAIVVGCTQETPLFEDMADAWPDRPDLRFVNVREMAGWSNEQKKAGPKTAALVAASLLPVEPAKAVTLNSEGVALILGNGQEAIDAAVKLSARLDVTVILETLDGLLLPRRSEFPIRQGKARMAKGWLGAFEVTVDGYREPSVSSRERIVLGPARDGLVSRCDLVIDLTGRDPLFPASDLRPGYHRADPASPVDVARMLFEAGDMVGSFDKPRYIEFTPDLCAHSRSRITGCTRCLDLCPTGAITPAGDHVAISTEICAGCGACAAHCPTGAANYALPAPDQLLTRLRTLLSTYQDAGGESAVILFHDESHGAPLIDALARYGDGLPARVIPVQVNEVSQVGIEAVAAAFAYGGAGVTFLQRAKPKHDPEGLWRTVSLARRLIGSQGYGDAAIALIETDDPDALGAALRTRPPKTASAKVSRFLPMGNKRDLLTLSLREMHMTAPEPVAVVALDKGAPFGRVNVDTSGCTLCLSCVSACPVSALGDNPDKPMLTFDESLCVQCGLCAATCPEKVITLEPRVNFAAFGEKPIVLHHEEPAHCTECGKAFGVKSTIDRIAAKLEGKHWMFTGANANRLAVLRMCEDCRVGAMTAQTFDPYGAPARPAAKTTDDYLREREEMERLRQENKKASDA